MNNSISIYLENITASLLSSFRLVPPAAIPAMLDCILASTNSSSSSLFNSLLNEFSNVTKEITEGSEKTDSGRHYCISSYVGALCHLLKKSGTNINAFELFIWRTFVPILKLVHASHLEIFNEVSSMFFDVVAQTNSWHVVEKSLLPFLFRLVWLSMGMNHSQESAIVEWSSHLNLLASDMSTNLQSFQCSNGKLTNYLNMEPPLSQLDYLPLPVSCHILILTLDAALEYKDVINSTCSLDFANEGSVENLVRNLLWDLCDLSFQMLSESAEHRSSAIRILLPSIFEALESNCAFDLSIRGQKHMLSRNHLLEKIWACCKRLFPLGLSERRDAYAILSLYLSSSFTNESKDGNIDGKGETFDLRGDKEFWDEIRRGLVDKENLVRKQSLHILKRILNLSDQRIPDPGLSEGRSDVKSSVTRGLTKRERWAEKEAMSLGVGKMYNVFGKSFNSHQKWGAFTLLYEMLEEYGTHLVEAAWDHQMNLLLRSSFALENQVSSSCGESHQNKMVTSEEICQWLAVLWERGFYHDNPQVRCLIMQSFLGIAWDDYESYVRSVPEEFILGPLMQGLNDPVHHKDFGLKGIYASRTIHSAANFLYRYCSCLDRGKQIKFLSGLALLSKKHSFGRPGLMCFAECIASAAQGVVQHEQVCSSTGNSWETDRADLLDLFRFIIESSKQHFNSSYRFQVCEKILDAAASVMSPVDVPVEILLHFISSLPREFTDFGGSLRMKIQKWLLMWNEENFTSNYCRKNLELSETLAGFARNFVYCHPADAHITYDDEDVDKWDREARRWARVTFLVLKEEQNLDTIFNFIRDCGSNLCKENNLSEWVPVKYFIIISSLVQELRVIQEKIAEGPGRERMKTDPRLPIMLSCVDFVNGSTLVENISQLFLSIMDEAVSFSKSSSSIFWSALVEDESILPGPVRGRLGGPSQRRLSSSATTSVLQAITSLKSVASISRWCLQFRSESHVLLDSALIFLWNFCWKVIKSPSGRSESEAEMSLASYEAMAHVLKELVPAFSSSSLHLIMDKDNLSNMELENEKFLDSFVQTFLQSVNNLIGVENLVRTRRAILMNWKWICLESLLSIPNFVLQNKNGVHMRRCRFFFSGNTVTWIFNDLVDNLENAGEVSVLPILRSVRLTMELFASGRMGSVVSSCNGLTPQMMWDLVNPCWILHVSCNKRRVAPIAALLSSVLHHSLFGDESMHDFDDGPGPLKWFIKQMLEEGTRSPRTIRLAALHLTGLWLRYPTTIKHYIRELKLLTLYGSVAFDEDFEAELAENQDAKSEVSTLAQSPDPELTEEFINTELYARVCVAVLFNKLADTVLVGSIKVDQNENSLAALASGKIFLLELLHSAVDDKDLSKELYKKYSAIHRRKIRVWQMICILSRFIDQDILEKVTCSLHKALQRNNLPSVRQYMETFAIQIYLKFPFLVGKQLVQFLRDYDIRPQALSSYVFIAANVILHAAKPIQSGHLNELLPPIIPLLTSHHHTLRGFAQLLVHQILQKLLHAGDSDASVTISLEKRCLMDLESYLMCNPDCARLRASMEGYLDAFDPNFSVRPAGVFTNRVEELEFECVSKTLMDQVITFLNDARDDLRCSMAKDAATIKNEHLQINDHTNHIVVSGNTGQEPEDVALDFQKKFTLCKHEMQTASGIFTDKKESFRSFTDIDKEDQLLDQLLQSRNLAVQKLRESRQHIILVASLIDRIPNLAGLARTCEVFRAAGLAIADKNILSDKQFQLISVTAEKWVPITEVPVSTMKVFLQKKKREGFAILGLEQTANSIPLDHYAFPRKTVLVLGREKEGIPAEIIHILDACVEIPQLGVVRSLNVHVSGAIALWEYTRQQRSH